MPRIISFVVPEPKIKHGKWTIWYDQSNVYVKNGDKKETSETWVLGPEAASCEDSLLHGLLMLFISTC